MKKLAIIVCVLTIFTGAAHSAVAIDNTEFNKKVILPNKEKMDEQRKAHEREFEQKLGLTDSQKTKARELRQQGFTKMKPVMDEIHLKRQEALKVKNSNLSNEEKEQKLTIIDKDIRELHKQAAEIRKQNMKDFESILDKKQRTTLKNMKKEGRENFNKEHKMPPVIDGQRPPMPPKVNFYSNN